jgi:hypothetical protein
MEIGETFITHLNFQTFGCNKDYFNNHIRDKELKVIFTNTRIVTVEDEIGGHWNISVQDLIRVIKQDTL